MTFRWAATSVRSSFHPIENMGVANCNDQIAARAWGCKQHIPPMAVAELMQYDGVFATQFKIKESFEPRWMDVLHQLCDAGKKVVLFQEAETAWPLTRPWDEQKDFMSLLGKVELFLTHNSRDTHIWGSFCTKYKSMRWRTCIDTVRASSFRTGPNIERPIIFGSSYDGRANGLIGLIACKDLGQLWHQNRSTGYEDRNAEMAEAVGVTIAKEIPHSNWEDWMRGVAGAYVAVHPMPAASAGRDQITFAALGIPCIGNEELDIQRELFPALAVNIFDINRIRELVKMLYRETEFYRSVQNEASRQLYMYSLKSAEIQANEIKQTCGMSE